MKHQNKPVYYVYWWSLNKKILYVGKGTCNRVSTSDCAERNLFQNGYNPYDKNINKKIVFYNLTHKEALEIEDMLIEYFGKRIDNSGILLNKINGTKNRDKETLLKQIKYKFPNMKNNISTN